MPDSNDHLSLIPRTQFDGPSLKFDLPGLSIGIAEYDAGPTGCTVFHFPNGAQTAIDVRGGMVGMTFGYDYSHGICLAGGSLMGLEAAAGVAAGLFAQGGHMHQRQPLVNGACIFDYGRRANTIYPDKTLGRAALEAAQPGCFPLGARGAGRLAGVGGVFGFQRSERSGQGGAIQDVSGAQVAVFTVVNALGVVVNRAGTVVRGNRDPETGERKGVVETLAAVLAQEPGFSPPDGNTTLTVLITDRKLDRNTLTQLGRMVHSSMARAIRPFHTQWDGDVLYAVTTNQVESKTSLMMFGLAASEVAWEAVLAAVAD
jgi:L-aminopeptidase/D-esterase-like protein